MSDSGVRLVVVDSLNGYMNAMPEERALAIQLHELLTYLTHLGVSSFLVMAQHGLVGQGLTTPIDISYLADTVLLLRYFEAEGRVRKAISVVKKRSGAHEQTIREFSLGTPGGLVIGAPLSAFQGVLSGTPQYVGDAARLLGARKSEQRMTGARPDSLAVALLAPLGRDAALAAEYLRGGGFDPLICADFEELCGAVKKGIGCALVTEEALAVESLSTLAAIVGEQAPWSDLPFLVFSSRPDALRQRTAAALQELGNVSFIDRPVPGERCWRPCARPCGRGAASTTPAGPSRGANSSWPCWDTSCETRSPPFSWPTIF